MPCHDNDMSKLLKKKKKKDMEDSVSFEMQMRLTSTYVKTRDLEFLSPEEIFYLKI